MPQFAPLRRLLEYRGIIGGRQGDSRLVCGENYAISGGFKSTEIDRIMTLSAATLPAPATPVESSSQG
jgi:hypothetical protein